MHGATASQLVGSAADLAHRFVRPDELHLVDLMPGPLREHRAFDACRQFVVGGTAAHQPSHVVLLQTEEAVAELALGREPDAIARVAERVRHAGDDADLALLVDDGIATEVRTMTGDIGANAVFDFVGSQSTVELAAKLLGPDGDLHIIGLGGGMLPVGFGATAYDVTVRTPHWGSLPELTEIIALAKAGKITAEFEQFPLEDGPAVYERLHAGEVRGRAVLVP